MVSQEWTRNLSSHDLLLANPSPPHWSRNRVTHNRATNMSVVQAIFLPWTSHPDCQRSASCLSWTPWGLPSCRGTASWWRHRPIAAWAFQGCRGESCCSSPRKVPKWREEESDLVGHLGEIQCSHAGQKQTNKEMKLYFKVSYLHHSSR